MSDDMSDDTTATIALVTGANKGIGKEVARQLAAGGALVWLGARDEARGRAAEAELRDEGGDVRYVPLDVTDPATITAAGRTVEEAHGRLDVLVNNAGMSGAASTFPPTEVPIDALRALYEANFFGAVAVTNTLLPLVLRSPRGRVVNVSSELGSLALVGTDDRPLLLAYNSAKSALNMATRLWAQALAGTNVKVNAVNPGYCATDLNDFRGVLSAADGAKVVVSAATLPEGGPSGAFLGADGPLPW